MKQRLTAFAPALACSLLMGLTAASLPAVVAAQPAGAGARQGLLGQKLQAVRTALSDNQQKLHQYTWTETSDITVNGRNLPPRQSTCSYGPDGKVHKVPLTAGRGEPAAGRGGGRLVHRLVEQKEAGMKESGQQLAHLIGLYLPPNPQKIGQAFRERKVSFNRAGGDTDLIFHDYALAGDSMSLDTDRADHRMRALQVHTWLQSPQAVVNLQVEFATLPDGTNHPARTTLEVPAKNLHIVNTNSDYRKTAG